MDVARHGQLKGVLTTWLLLINDETRDIVSEEVVADIAADNWKERIKEIVGREVMDVLLCDLVEPRV